jgi:hypothetical protein
MLQPLTRKGGSPPPVARTAHTPAPTGGWNARNNIADMPPTDAAILDNWFPGTSRVRIRRGFEEHVTGLPDIVETLMTYSSGTADKMFAASNNAIYDVTTPGVAGAAAVSSKTNNRWQYTNIGTPGGSFLIGVNGADTPIKYDGSSWGTSAITGSTSTSFIHINLFKRRLFFTIKNSLKFAYLPVETIAGAAVEFDLAPICQLGGYLMAMGTWTRDGGDGLDDFAVFYTSKGEVLLYQGSNPGDATDWSLVGRFEVGAPIGRRCMSKAGSDLILISQDGFLPLSSSLSTGRATKRIAISDKIRDYVNSAARDYRDNFGWQGILYPRGSMAIFNIPKIEGVESEQCVANTNTGAWCRFTGMDAMCWGLLNEDLYFGGDSAVYKADSGFSDNGANISGDVQQAYSSLGYGALKAFRQIRPVFTTDGVIHPSLAINIDYETLNPTSSPTFTAPVGAVWDISPWDDTAWSVGLSVSHDYVSVEGVGYVGAIRMKLDVMGFEVFWNNTDWLYEPGAAA